MDSAGCPHPAPSARSPHSGWGAVAVAAVFLIYAALSFLRHSPELIWDEQRYLESAENLTHGFYVPDKDPNFVNGPGYPLVLLPFVSGPGAWLWARVLNAAFMAGAAGFVWLTVRRYAGPLWALGGVLVTAFHPTFLWMGFSLMSEPLSVFLLTGFAWAFTRALAPESLAGKGGWRWAALAVFFFTWLIMTRVFFGHVLAAMAGLSLLLLLGFKDWRPALRRTLAILAAAFVLCLPWLGYTYSKTGHVMCWSTNSSELLYWLTSHREGENGHWFGRRDVETKDYIHADHKAFYHELFTHPILEREKMYKERAVAQFKEAPAKVAYNWLCNLSRLAFGFPRSHQPEELRMVVLVLTNGPLILLVSLAGLLGLYYWRCLPVEIWLLMAMAAFYLGGSSLAPALPRYFVLMVPVLWLGLAAVCHRLLKMKIGVPKGANSLNRP